ncbi:CDP-diacylglycerol--serine O-phosphatidyltransferase [Insolitispirillum peregrinum]|uniref:CDP-diacylglycerol--serine O-phosphatidyltransferase n=1 Tax=Insolitispirillum peregrinum TaxID=80876 RepID=A0A1N7Q5S2_9PROT|nr:CDP-diacylglycerol--serine O-phosphatidyltransferase [Insolitispirillum peregrinum]SIT18218.1 CDP-diacylglycerol---serine O-phosphatidyltransferase [Insolitispirillum peregrinum]
MPMMLPGQRGLKTLSFNKMIPNMVTLLALSAGLTSIRYGLRDEWERAVIAIFLAALFDAMDGRVARMLKATSKFGAELDSLSDFISFGVAPAVLLYMWTLSDAGGFGWALSLLLAICCALRLARFNTMLGEPDLPGWAHNYFTGVPAPAAAGLALLPMVLSFEFDGGFFEKPAVVAFFVLLVSFLMVSRLPTYSFKRVRIPALWVLPTLICVGILAAFLVTEPWATLGVIGLVYIGTFPLSFRSFHRLSARARQEAAGTDTTDQPATGA